MATKKITLSQIKSLIKSGAAIDIDSMKIKPQQRKLKLIGISFGINGANGALFLHENGKMYAIKSRNSTLFMYR